jgi:hypothetical protein
MSLIRLRFGPRDVQDVSVRAPECPNLRCFWATQQMVRSPAGMSGASSRTTDYWVCGYRDQRGCPPEGQRTPAEPPRYRKRRGAWERIET